MQPEGESDSVGFTEGNPHALERDLCPSPTETPIPKILGNLDVFSIGKGSGVDGYSYMHTCFGQTLRLRLRPLLC